MMRGPRVFTLQRIGIARITCAGLLSLAGAGSAQAEGVVGAPSATAANDANLFILDTTYGDSQSPLYFEVAGLGFQPGEPVTIRASLVSDAASGSAALPLPPVQVTANGDGQIEATIDGNGYAGAGSGFVIRASSAYHRASIVDLVLTGASVTSPDAP